jgi:hypothetical protein
MLVWLKDEYGWPVKTADEGMNPTSLLRFISKCDQAADCPTRSRATTITVYLLITLKKLLNEQP